MEYNSYKFLYQTKQQFAFFLASDIHLMSDKFDRARFIADMENAKGEGARVYFNGDIFDMILPSDMKRYSRASSKHNVDAIINTAVAEAVELLAPYADIIDIIGLGNHDTAPIKYHHVDAVLWLINELNRHRSDKTKKRFGNIRHGGYSGFVRLSFELASGGHAKVFDIYYNHGQGGAAEVTKGSIDLNRRQYISADLIWLGHKHTKKLDYLDAEIGVDHTGRIYERKKLGVITGCYLKASEQYDINKEGYRLNFSEEHMRTPQATGGVLLYISVSRDLLESRVLI